MTHERTRSTPDRHDAGADRAGGGSGWRDAPARDLCFPYMAWAHSHSGRTALPLTQSGMPMADPAFLDSLGRLDIDHPSKAALPELEEAIARRFGVGRERVLVTLGASGGLHLAALRWFRPGARVVADVPSYEPFRALPRLLGADLRLLERRLADGWQVDPQDVRRLFSTGKGPGHVFLANPHNPTGARLDRARLAAIAHECDRAGGLLVSCDIYMEYVPPAERVYAFEVAPNAVTIGSLTKAYGLGALRIGWIVLGEGLARERVHLVDMAYVTYVDPPTATLRAGKLAMERLDALLEPLRLNVRLSRPIWARWLRETEGIAAFVPDHGLIAFPHIEGVADTLGLCEFLVAEHGVDVVPGEFFGLAGHVRVGCGLPADKLSQALERLARGIQAFRAR